MQSFLDVLAGRARDRFDSFRSNAIERAVLLGHQHLALRTRDKCEYVPVDYVFRPRAHLIAVVTHEAPGRTDPEKAVRVLYQAENRGDNQAAGLIERPGKTLLCQAWCG